ncbi:hypothetical protein FALBO_16181, partial [Fusarium albosuccineum]
GKSFLSSKVIDRYRIDHEETTHCSGQHDEGFALFYCSRFERARRNLKNILRSYIRQLSEVPRRSARIHKAPYDLYQRGKKIQADISLNDCKVTLEEIINSYPRTTLVLDALDECEADTRRQIAEFFQHLTKTTTRLLKVFLASRKEVGIESYLKSFQGPQMLVQISISDNSSDIEKYVIEKMAKQKVKWKDITPNTKQLVQETLVEKSDGMFRWTYLQWEHLKECSTNDAIRQKLRKLPKTLSGAYDEIYNQYDPEDYERVMLQRTVRWVICALEPLDSLTLLSAIRLESERIDGERAFDESDLTDHTLESAKKVLGSPQESIGVKPVDNSTFGIVAFGFHRALAGWWDKDLDHSLVNSDGQDLLSIAARFGHIDLCEDLLGRGFDVDKHVEKTSQTALGEAMEGRQIETMRLLLKSGANPNWVMQDCSLLCSAAATKDEYVQALLEAGADPDIKCDGTDCEFGCALSTAAWFGNVGAVQALIQKGATINPEPLGGEYGSPLAAAAHRGNLDCTRLLIEHGADPNACLKFGKYGSPLTAAARRGQLDCAHFLIEHGADANACLESGEFGSPLAAAASGGKFDCVRLLIDNGANIDARLGSGKYGSILNAAIVGPSPSLAVVKFLVEEAKADPTQLLLNRLRNIQIKSKEERREIAAYLIQKRQIKAQVLIDNGVPPEDMPPDTVYNVCVSSTASEDEGL